MNIDIKDNDDELIEAVHSLIEEFGRQEFTVWGNISYTVTQKCYKRVRANLGDALRANLILLSQPSCNAERNTNYK